MKLTASEEYGLRRLPRLARHARSGDPGTLARVTLADLLRPIGEATP